MTGFLALGFPIISLCCKYSLFIKSCFIKLMIHIGCKYKIFLVFYNIIKLGIKRQCRRIKAVHQYMFGPVSPLCLLRRIWIKSGCIHICHVVPTVFFYKFCKIVRKPFTAILDSCRCRCPGSCTDYNTVCISYILCCPTDLVFICILLKYIIPCRSTT